MALTRKKFLIAKIESTYGTDSTPVGGTDAVQVTDLEVVPIEADNIVAPTLQGFIGNSTRSTLLANKRVSVSFGVELAGSGTQGTPPAYGPLLRACGMSETIFASTGVTYAGVSSNFDSVTIYCFYDGTRHKITGCRGTVTFNFTSGQFATASFEMTGIYNAPDDTALSGSFTVANQAAAIEVSYANATFPRFNSVNSARFESLDFALNNNVIYKESLGSKEILIVDRQPGGTAVLEAPDIGTTDYFASAVATSTGVTSVTVGTDPGNRVNLLIDQTDITGISYSDTNGVVSLTMPYLALPTTTGNDEFNLIFN